MFAVRWSSSQKLQFTEYTQQDHRVCANKATPLPRIEPAEQQGEYR